MNREPGAIVQVLVLVGEVHNEGNQTALDDAMNSIVGASITYRLTFGPNAGRKALTLKTVPATERPSKPNELVIGRSA